MKIGLQDMQDLLIALEVNFLVGSLDILKKLKETITKKKLKIYINKFLYLKTLNLLNKIIQILKLKIV